MRARENRRRFEGAYDVFGKGAQKAEASVEAIEKGQKGSVTKTNHSN